MPSFSLLTVLTGLLCFLFVLRYIAQVVPELGSGFLLISSTLAFYNELARLGNRKLNFVTLKQQHNALLCQFLPLHCFVCSKL